MDQQTETAPPVGLQVWRADAGATEWIERRAKLFEAGEYPDRGLTVTRQHLERLERTFRAPVPVWIEHASSPLEIGYLTQVAAHGDELHGVIALTKEANALIERSGARSLSLGLAGDLSEIREVSLVEHPRIADARLFAGAVRFDTKLEAPVDPEPDWKARCEELQRREAVRAARAKTSELVRQGKLLPAQVPFAEAILLASGSVEFGDGSEPIGRTFERLLDLQPEHGMFRMLTEAQRQEAAENLLLPEEVAFYRRHFPGIDLGEIAARK